MLAVLLAVLLLAWSLMSSQLGAAFDGGHIGLTGAWYSLAGRNFQEYGPLELCFTLCRQSGPVVESPMLYLSHPGGIGLYLYGVFSIFGEGEFQARSAALALSLFSVAFFFLFFRNTFRASVPAFFASMIAVTSPVWAIYGSLIDPHGPGILAGMALALWAAERYASCGTKRSLLLSYLGVVIACSFDWAGILVAVGIGSLAVLSWPDRPKLARFGYFVVGGLWILMLMGLGEWAAARHGADMHLGTELLHRSSFSPETLTLQGEPITRARGFVQVLLWCYKDYFVPVSIVGLIAGLGYFRELVQRRLPRERLLFLVPIFFQAVLMTFFFEAIYEHDYLQIYLAPGLGALLGHGMQRLCERRPAARAKVIVSSMLFLVLAYGWAMYRVGLRWEVGAETRAVDREIGLRLQKCIPRERKVACNVPFYAPVAYYSDRGIIWWPESRKLETRVDRLGGILIRGTPPESWLPILRGGGWTQRQRLSGNWTLYTER